MSSRLSRLLASSSLRTGLAAFALVGLGAGATLLLQPQQGIAQSKSPDTYRQLNLFGEVFERVRAEYVEPVTDEQLIEAAINGMLTSLDPHSIYFAPKTFKDMQVQTKGEFGGLGIEVSTENGLVKVVSPIDETPAARAGLRPGDFITHLNGESLMGLQLNEAVEKMRGPVNSEVKLTVRREGREPFDVAITRAVIKIQSVRSRVEGDDIGYVRITSFNEQTDAGLQKAVAQIKEKAGNKLKGLILDLRRNPGGLLDQAVAVSDAFLEKGEIVSTRGRQSDTAQRFNAKPGDILGGLPLVVLIDQGSASASEIVAGALQDHQRAILMGVRSFGKGSVQTQMPLPGNGGMRLTTAYYYTPSGRSIQRDGIEPDINVPMAKLEVLDAGPRRSEASLRGALSNPNQKDKDKDPAADKDKTTGATPAAATQTGREGEGDDYQLARAVDLIRGLALYSKRNAN